MSIEFFEGRPPFKFRDPRVDPCVGDVLNAGGSLFQITGTKERLGDGVNTVEIGAIGVPAGAIFGIDTYRKNFRLATVVEIAAHCPGVFDERS